MLASIISSKRRWSEMLAFSNDYYGFIFRVTQSVELFCTYETKTSCKQFVAAYQQQTEYLRNELPIGVCNQILGTQHRSNINTLQKFISKS